MSSCWSCSGSRPFFSSWRKRISSALVKLREGQRGDTELEQFLGELAVDRVARVEGRLGDHQGVLEHADGEVVLELEQVGEKLQHVAGGAGDHRVADGVGTDVLAGDVEGVDEFRQYLGVETHGALPVLDFGIAQGFFPVRRPGGTP